MGVGDEHLDVMQNIESQVVAVYRAYPQLTDYDVDKAYAALEKALRGGGESLPAYKPAGELPGLVYERASAIIGWRLGQNEMKGPSGKRMPTPEPVTPEVVVSVLKRLRRSLSKWTKDSGRQGYLLYIVQFL